MSDATERHRSAAAGAGFTRTTGFSDDDYVPWTPTDGDGNESGSGGKKSRLAAWGERALEGIEKLRNVGRAWFGLVVAGVIILTLGQEELKRAEQQQESKVVEIRAGENYLESWIWHAA